MMNTDQLADLLHSGEVSRADQLLACLSQLGPGSHSTSQIREVARSHGVSDANIPRDMSRLKGLVFVGPSGWTLTTQGKKAAVRLLGNAADPHVAAQSASLRALLPKLGNDVQAFVAEAVACFEAKHFRAAVVLSWVGAVSVLYALVIRTRLDGFNTEATRRDAKWRPAKRR